MCCATSAALRAVGPAVCWPFSALSDMSRHPTFGGHQHCVLLHLAAGACTWGSLAVALLPLVAQRGGGAPVAVAGIGWALVTGADFRKGFGAREQRYLEPTLSPSLLMVPHAGREAGEEGRELFF